MAEPRQLQPVTFLHGEDSPVTRPDASLEHPSHGAPSDEVLSYSDYYRKSKGLDAPEPTEEQLSFRRYVRGEATQSGFPESDIPED